MGAFIGSAVVDGRVRFLSVSSLQKYDRTEPGGCPRSWWFRYPGKKKEPETESMRRGTELARELEHYLKTGEDVLSPVVREGKRFLPAPGPDLEVEQPLGDIAEAVRLADAGDYEAACRAAGLSAGGVPLMGAADLRHFRREYVDENGVLRPDEAEVEVVDHKTTSRIDHHTSASGRVYQGYAKTAEQVAKATQMVGYGIHAIRKHGVEKIRLSHVYYQTKNGLAASKRTGLISADELLRRWDRIDGIAREIQDVARETDPTKVETNLDACNAFGRACPHSDYCPRSPEQMLTSMFSSEKPKLPRKHEGKPPQEKENIMSSILNALRSKAPYTPAAATTAPVVPPPAPQSSAARDAQIAAEKARLLAEDGIPNLPSVPEGHIPVTACEPGGKYLDGNGAAIDFVGASGGQYFFVYKNGSRLSMPASGSVKPATHMLVIDSTVGSVNPPDGLRPGLAKAADPLPPETIATISDPELKARAEAHAAGAEVKAEPTKGRKKKAAEAAVSNENVAEPQISAGEGIAVRSTPLAVVPTIYLDCAVIGSPQPQPLSSYYDPIVALMLEKSGAVDLRCATGEDLGFGKWKGVLAALCKARPIEPGEYVASSMDEIEAVVISALRARIVRGVR